MNFDTSSLKHEARGRWRQIIAEFIPAELLDGHHHPCPRCGGTDRFRAFDDFDESGGVICNQCFNHGNGDGIATLRWLIGSTFTEAKEHLAERLNLKPSTNGHHHGNGHSGNGKVPSAGQNGSTAKEKAADDVASGKEPTFDKLRFVPMDDAKLEQFAESKPPILVDAIKAAGTKLALWPKKSKSPFLCVAIPARGPQGFVPGAILYRVDGQPFPAFGRLAERKTHIARRSPGKRADGWAVVGTLDRLESSSTIWKAEGVPDALALYPHLPEDHCVVTNIAGAKAAANLSLDIFSGKQIFAVPDADTPGVGGVERFASKTARVAASVRIVTLPYPVKESGGKDLRDFLNDGGTFADLLALAEQSEPVEAKADDPQAADTIRNSDVEHNAKGEAVQVPRPMASILSDVDRLTGGWPCRVGRALFIDDGGRIDWLENTPALAGYLGTTTGRPPLFIKSAGFHSLAEVTAELQRTAKSYIAVETLPHEPLFEGHYYCCGSAEPGDGETLSQLVDRFTPETGIDRDLILAAFVTPFCGIQGGTRPAFAVTSGGGRGKGKSRLAEMVGYVAGGYVSVESNSPVNELKTRLLSPVGLTMRVVIIDNIKSHRFSWADLEALITASHISGRRNYVGEGQRPNTLTWLLTLNGPSMSKDMAQRSCIIRLADPTYSGDWHAETVAFIDANRQAIVGDIIGFLRSDRFSLHRYSRWGQWEREVVERLPEPGDVQKVILERQSDIDVEAEEAGEIERAFRERLERLNLDTLRQRIFVPSTRAAEWLGKAIGESLSTTKASRMLGQKIDEGELPTMQRSRTGTTRGFYWIGPEADPSAEAIDIGRLSAFDTGFAMTD